MGRPSKYPDELRERAVRMVAEVRPQYPSQWAAITAVAGMLGIGTPETLRTWLGRLISSQPAAPIATTTSSARLRLPLWAMTTLTSRARRSAGTRPIPPDPPVTMPVRVWAAMVHLVWATGPAGVC